MLERKYEINTTKQNVLIYSFLLLLSILFLIINSTSTSPFLFRIYGEDSSIFMSMGKMFYSGAIPYVDFFDHKGPVIIFIQALAAALFKDVRCGAFLLQVVSLFFTLIIIYKTIRSSLSDKSTFIIILLFLIMFSRFIAAGNSTEEYCLFVSFLTLYYSIKFLKSKYTLSAISYFIIGLSFAFSFWIRANNSAVIVACMLFMFIVLISNKNYNELIKMICYFVLGIIIVSLPIILYFIYIGAFNQMIDAAFIVNFDYLLEANEKVSSVANKASLDYYIFVFTPFIALLGGTVLYYLRYKNKDIVILSVCLTVVCYVATLTGHPFLHYSMLNLPCFVLGSFLLLFVFEQKYKQKYHTVLLVFFILVLLALSLITVRNTLSTSKEKEENLKQIIEKIPVEDYNSVFTYEIGAEFYLITDALPYCKYYILQEWQAEKLKRENIFDEVNRILTEKPAKWILIDKTKDIRNTQLLNIINSNYQLVIKKDKQELYKKKDI